MSIKIISKDRQTRLDNSIMSNIDDLAKAYNRKNKNLYKQCLFALELDLQEYRDNIKKEHPAQETVIKLYEKLWEL